MSLYFILLVASVAIPFILSFDKRLQFYKQWKYVLPSIFVVAIIYIYFDVLLTENGIWGFNPRYLSGHYIFNLPIEECLFFFAIPYASIFLHYSIKEYFPKLKFNSNVTKIILQLLIAFNLLILIFQYDKHYTMYISIKTMIVLVLALLDKSKTTSVFLISYLVILIPFIIVNGILTGSFITDEIVWYNNAENLGIRFFTIPVEDFAYAFSMILFNLLLIENLKRIFEKK